jgi:CelD/BcsL family acetyltransferase involved in cellulose biosynthesis
MSTLEESSICKTTNSSVKVIKTVEEFKELRAEWNGLVEEGNFYIPWLCWEWFDLWIRHFLGDNQLLILILYDSDDIVAIAPFIMRKERYKNTLETRKVELIGNAHSPIRSILFANYSVYSMKEKMKAILAYFFMEFRDWDVMEYYPVPEERGVYESIHDAAAEMGLLRRPYDCFSNWHMDDIKFTGDAYMKSLSTRLLQEMRRRRRRLREIGNIVFDVGEEVGQLGHYIELYNKVRGRSWKRPEHDRDFLWHFRRLSSDKGWLRFFFLFVNNEPIAAQIRLVSNGTAYFLSTVYDARYRKYSPGALLLSDTMKYLIDEERVKEIDNMRGNESYKREWFSSRRQRKGLTIFNSTANGRLLGLLTINLLPFVEKNSYVKSFRNKLATYLKRMSA